MPSGQEFREPFKRWCGVRIARLSGAAEQETWFESADHAVQFQNVKLRCAE